MEDKVNSGNTAVEATETISSPVKKATKAKSPKAQKSKASHPPTSEMVNNAIKELKDRKGSSLQAIKKYIATTYKVDGEKLAPFIKRYLKTAVTSGAVVQTKGKGASGSFKLATTKTESKAKVQRAPKVVTPKKTKKSVEKKTTPARKPAATKKAAVAKKPVESPKKAATKKAPSRAASAAEKAKPAAESKAVSKAKKTVKAPAAKTKTPKPKKAAATKTVKAAAKK